MSKISLVIPCYNEGKSLLALIEKCRQAFKDQPIEVVLVNNGSSDDTAEQMQVLLQNDQTIRYVTVEKNQGYGFGILAGLRTCQSEYLAWTHADLQTDPADLIKALSIIDQFPKEKLFIKGTRKKRPLFDVFFTVGMSAFETLLLQTGLHDINAQPTVFPKSFFDTWKNPPHDFSLDLFSYYMAKKQGYTIKRFPVYFTERLYGESHWNTSVKAKLKFIQRVVQYSMQLRKVLKK